MDGTLGQKIVEELALPHAFYIENKVDEEGTIAGFKFDDLYIGLSSCHQVVIEKQSTTPETNIHFRNAMNYLKTQGIKNAVVYGVATDYCVKDAVNSLLRKGLEVYVVTDAITGIDENNSKKTLDDFVAQNTKLVKSADILRGI